MASVVARISVAVVLLCVACTNTTAPPEADSVAQPAVIATETPSSLSNGLVRAAREEPTTHCEPDTLAQAVADARGEFEHKPTRSPAELADVSPIIIRGSVIFAEPHDGGTSIAIKVFATTGRDAARPIQHLWIPFDQADLLEGKQFVAFLTNDTVPISFSAFQGPTVTTSAHVVNPEGMWLACDATAPAVSVIAEPLEPGWELVRADGISLTQLWTLAQFPDGDVVTTVQPSAQDEDHAIYDLQLVTGERFRLSLPAALAGDLTMTEHPVETEAITFDDGRPAWKRFDPLDLVGDSTTVRIRYEDKCPIEDSPVTGLGVQVRVTDRAALVCRPGELLVMTIATTEDFRQTAGGDAAEFIDLIPISRGQKYGPLFWHEIGDNPDCSSCPPFGPHLFIDGDLAVYRVSGFGIAAFDLSDLSERWRMAGDDRVRMHWPHGQGVIVEYVGGGLALLDAATGETQWQTIWQVQQAPETQVQVSSHAEDLWLVRSISNKNIFLRRIDLETGEIMWTAPLARSSWLGDRPAVINGVVLTLSEEIRPVPLESEFHLAAFDLETGEATWSQTFDSLGRPVQQESLAVFDVADGPAVVVLTAEGSLARVEPATGDLLWRVRVGAALFGGTEFAADGTLAIDLITPGGQVLIDPATGETLDG